MTRVVFRGGPWRGEEREISESWINRDIYPLGHLGGFYFQHDVDEPVWDWIVFEIGKGKLADKLRELGLENEG